MTDLEQAILKGAVKMYDTVGEMTPVKMFDKTDIYKLVSLGYIKIVDDPYGIGDDFFGVVGKSYPIGSDSLFNYRSMRRMLGDNQMARSLCKCIDL